MIKVIEIKHSFRATFALVKIKIYVKLKTEVFDHSMRKHVARLQCCTQIKALENFEELTN